MNIVIAHNGIKRTIAGNGFNLCGNKEDLLTLADQIMRHVGEDWAYGWIRIRDEQTDDHASKANTTTLPWDAGVF